MNLFGRLGLLVCIGAFTAASGCRGQEVPAARVFAAWDGTWRGRFEVQDASGRTTQVLDVEQRYRSESDDLQHGEFVERDLASGRVQTARAMNSRRGDVLRCVVEKSSGERIEHIGRAIAGGIEWRREVPGARERFEERIVTSTSGDTIYEIRGWGEYGGGPRLTFRGRYVRQP